jgi:hypothetical protein
MNDFVRSRNGWVTSIPGAIDVTMECQPGSSLPDDLRASGYEVTATGEGERILPTAIVEKFVTGADGTLVALTEGSTRPVTSTVTHAGIIRVQRFAFDKQ